MDKDQFKATAAAIAISGANEHLSEREKHLIGLAVTATRGCLHCTGGRIAKAIESGISRETLVAAIDLAAAVNAGVTIRTALTAVEQSGLTAPCTDVACVGVESNGR